MKSVPSRGAVTRREKGTPRRALLQQVLLLNTRRRETLTLVSTTHHYHCDLDFDFDVDFDFNLPSHFATPRTFTPTQLRPDEHRVDKPTVATMPRKITIEMEVEIREAPEDECLNHKDIANKAAHRFLKESPANITNIAVDEGYASFGYRLLPNTEELIQNDSGCIVEHITSQYRYEGEGQTCRQPTYYSSSSDPSQINNPLFVMAPVPEIPQTIAEDLSPTVPPTPTTADFPYPLIPSTHLADQQFTQPISTTSDRQHRRLASRRNLQPSDANAQDALKPQRGRSSKVEKVKRMKLPFQNPDFQKNVQSTPHHPSTTSHKHALTSIQKTA